MTICPTTPMDEGSHVDVEEELRAELLDAGKRLDEATSLENELGELLFDRRIAPDGMLANAKRFRVEARKQYLYALKRFTSFVMGGCQQADVDHLRLLLERQCDHWTVRVLHRTDSRWLYQAQTTSGSHGKEVLLEFASAELGRTVLPEELSWIEVPGVPGVE
jgi:hypothetical protein